MQLFWKLRLEMELSDTLLAWHSGLKKTRLIIIIITTTATTTTTTTQNRKI